MASRVTLSGPALTDLGAIADHISADSPGAAKRVYDEIRSRCMNLAETPDIGQQLHSVVRRTVVGSYLVFYRVKPDRVQVARILHGARQVPPSLGG